MTVQELLNILSKFPPEIKVGRVGHFGEFHELSEFEVYKTNVRYRKENDVVIHIEPPNIGEEPD